MLTLNYLSFVVEISLDRSILNELMQSHCVLRSQFSRRDQTRAEQNIRKGTHMKIIGSVGLLIGLSGCSIDAHAEGNRPPYYYPIGNRSVAACAPIPNGAGGGPQGQRQAPSPQADRWADRFGSIASDADRGIYESVGDMVSISEAEKAAMANCQSKGGQKCKILLTYHNGCASLVFGDAGFIAETGPTVESANQKALQQCGAATTNCRVAFNACSMPVRIQ